MRYIPVFLALLFVFAMVWGCQVDTNSTAHAVGQSIRNIMYQATGF